MARACPSPSTRRSRSTLLAFALVATAAALGPPAPATASLVAVPDLALGPGGTASLGLPLVARSAVADRSGGVIVAGQGSSGPTIARVGEDGGLDRGFGSNGSVSVPAAGQIAELRVDPGVIRVLIDGPADWPFVRVDISEQGLVIGQQEFPSLRAAGLTTQGGVVGWREEADRFTLERYRADGSVDPAFRPFASRPKQTCSPVPPGRCSFLSFSAVSESSTGVVASRQSVAVTGSECSGIESVLTVDEETRETDSGAVSGCGVSTVQSLAEDPSGRVVASGWGAPPEELQYLRFGPDGSLDPRFGGDGKATDPTRDDGDGNVMVTPPAFRPSGAFFNVVTREGELNLYPRPNLVAADGDTVKAFRRKSQRARFGDDDGVYRFRAAATVLDGRNRVVLVGTADMDQGAVLAIARWELRPERFEARVSKWSFPPTVDGMADEGAVARTTCTLRCRAKLRLRVSQATKRRFGLPSRIIGRGQRRLPANRAKAVRAKLTKASERRFRARPGRIVGYRAILTARRLSGSQRARVVAAHEPRARVLIPGR